MAYFNNDDQDTYFRKNTNPPYLPDIHLKSACLSDSTIMFKETLINKSYQCHDPNILKAVDSFKNVTPEWVNDATSDIKIISDFESPRFYPKLWKPLKTSRLSPKVQKKLENRWTIFKTYFNRSKNHVQVLLLNLLDNGKHVEVMREILQNKNNPIHPDLIENIIGRSLIPNHKDKGVDDISLLFLRTQQEIIDSFDKLIINNSSFESFSISERLNWLKINMIKKQVSKTNSWSIFSLRQRNDTMIHKDFAIVKMTESEVCLLDVNQVLLLADTSMSRFLTLLNSNLMSSHLKGILPSEKHISLFYEWGDSVLELWGNDGYSLLKKVEAICIGVYLNKWDPLKESKLFLANLIGDTEEKFRPKLNELIMILEDIENPNELFEIFGLYRHIGHPIIDETLGCEKVKDVTRELININMPALCECLGASKKSFILEYIKKNKHWPRIDLDNTQVNLSKISSQSKLNEEFLRIIRNQYLNFSDYDKRFPLTLWSSIKFLKNFEFNDYEDFTPLLSDTAISPKRENWTQIYNRFLMKFYLPKDFSYSRRTLINILKRPDFSMKAIREVIQSGNIPKSWLIVALHSKERELRIHARLFAMMVLEMRMYFAVTEKNISDTLFKYVPTQTMTCSEADLNNRLLTLTNIKHKNKCVSVIFSLDIDKFNHRWRKESTDPFFSMIDDLFGTPDLYTFSHRFFENAFFCLSSYNHPPDYLRKESTARTGSSDTAPPTNRRREFDLFDKEFPNLERESDTTWIGQAGGCEGLRQKGWTFIITSALLATEESTGVRSYIIGQGDNQVLVCLFPIINENISEEDYIKSHANTLSKQIQVYQSELEHFMTGLGMKLKLEETWCSTTLMNYSKEILINGGFTTGYLKRISRAYSDINEVYPTLSTRISSIFSSCHSAAGKFLDPVIPYTIASTLTLDLFDQEVKNEGLSNFNWAGAQKIQHKTQLTHNPILTEEETTFLLFLNKEVGGYPVLPFFEFIYRGHPDPINTYLAQLGVISHENLIVNKIKHYISENYHQFKDSPINYLKLIQDPTSWNWKNQSMNTGVISNLLEDNLRNHTVNKDIRLLLDSVDKGMTKKMTDYLMSIKPVVPRILNEIFRQSPEGAKLNYLSTFSDMKTMKEMMSDNDSRSLIQFIEDSENKWIISVFYLFEFISNMRPLPGLIKVRWSNVYQLSIEITNSLWEINIEGSRIPHPISQFKLIPLYDNICWVCESLNHISQEYLSLFMRRRFKKGIGCSKDGRIMTIDEEKCNLFLMRGMFTPYMGSSTKEKRSKSLINFQKGDRALIGAQNLFRIKDWVVMRGGKLSEYIDSLIQSRTEIPFHIIKLAAGKYYGGSIVHRFNDVVTKHASRPNCRPNFYSHFYISSDTMGKYAGGKDNYNLHFQSSYLASLSIISMRIFWSIDLDTENYHFHVCNENAIPLSDIPPLESYGESPPIKDLSGSRLLFSTVSDYIDKTDEFRFAEHRLIDPSLLSNVDHDTALLSCAIVIYNQLMDRSTPFIAKDYNTGNIDISDIGITIDDCKQLKLNLIFQKVGQLWFLDNIRYIVQYSVRNSLSIKTTVSGLLSKLPSNSFSYMRSMLCNHLLIEEYQKFGWIPTSSKYLIDASSIEKEIIKEMIKGVYMFIKEKGIINKLIPYKSMTLNRWIIIYFQQLIYNHRMDSLESVLQDFSFFFNNIYCNSHQSQGNRTVEGIVTAYLAWTNTNTTIMGLESKILPYISVSGPEPWIREYKNKIKDTQGSSSVTFKNYTGSAQDIKKEKGIKVIAKIYNDMPRLSAIIFSRMSIVSSGQGDLLTHLAKKKMEPLRTIHQFRLTGLYSTAHYKYAEIFSFVPSKKFQYSINLAEGAGGVAKLCCQWFDCDGIIYNSLINVAEFSPQRAPNYIPPELIYITQVLKIPVYGVKECINTGGDLTNRIVIQRLTNLIQSKITKPSIMTMDAEMGDQFDPNQNIQLIGNTMELFNLLPVGSYLIIKTFYWYIDFFKYILAVLCDYFDDVSLKKSMFSSHENTEVFLIIKKKFLISNITIKKNISIPLDHESLINNYMASKPISPPIRTGDLLLLHSSFIKLGFDDNYSHSLKVITGHMINVKRFEENPLLEISEKIDFLVTYIRERVSVLYKTANNLKLNLHERIIKKHNPIESLDLQQNGELLINFYILRGVLLTREFNLSWIMKPLCIMDKTNGSRVIYRTEVRIGEWYNKYGRSLNRILGHLYLKEPTTSPQEHPPHTTPANHPPITKNLKP